MNGQEQDIERLLKAAAQQEPEPSPPAMKQQAWEQLRHMLDGQGAAPPAGKGWWFLLAGVVVLLSAGILFLFNNGSRPHAANNKDGNKDAPSVVIGGFGENEKGNNNLRDEKNPGKRRNAEGVAGAVQDVKPGTGAGNKTGDSENKAKVGTGEKNAKAFKDAGDTERNDKKNVTSAKDTRGINRSQKALKDAMDKGKSPSAKDVAGKITKDGEKDEKKKKTDRIDSEEKIKKNESTKNTVKEGDDKTEGPDDVNAETGNTVTAFPDLQPVYQGAANREKLFAVNQRIPLKAHNAFIGKPGPFNLKLAIIAADRGTWGGNLQAEYSYRLSPALVIRPSAGFTYITGAGNSYEHFYQDVKPDTGTRFKVDTARTYFTLKSMLHANLGIQLVYNTGKWSVFTGITYQYQLMQQGKDSSLPGSYTIARDSLPRYPDRFDANKLPGRNFLQWQAGVDYRLSPALRVGLQYNLGWGGSGGKGFVNSIPGFPNRQSLELQVRYYFRRKN